jgi:hypothetical protein
MGGGLMQLVAYGAQDVYLTGNPQITFFKVVYRRHTNFSMEAIEQTWNGNSTGSGRCTATISRNGDLVHRMYLELDGTAVITIDNPGATFITDIEVEIGGQKIDKHSGHWMETWAELTTPNNKGSVNSDSLTTTTLLNTMSAMGGYSGGPGPLTGCWFVPLQFWFCRNPGLALPLIALQYHEVKIILNHTFAACFGNTGKNTLWCDYIYLDTDERRRFAQVSHEYLIEQVQEQSLSPNIGDLNFNHPVKELIWSASRGKINDTTSTPVAGNSIILKLNGHDRFAARDFKYFTRVQVWQHHSGVGGLSCITEGPDKYDDSIGVYSFALKPEEHQPSGTCNFSRIDTAQLNGITNPINHGMVVFAVNYNVLRIMSGMGGLAYSN